MEKIIHKKRVLVLADYRCTTGFSTVTTNILRQVKNNYGNQLQFDIVAINWFGDSLPDDYEIEKKESADIKIVDEEHDGVIKKVKKRITVHEDENTTVYSAYYHDGKQDDFGRNGFLSFLKHIEYSLVFIIQDIGVVSPVLEVIKMIRQDRKKDKRQKKQFKVLYYFPKDSEAILPGWFDNFNVADRLIAYTEFAKEKALRSNLSLMTRDIRVIYHGVDTATFKLLPHEDSWKFRKAFFGKNASKFIVSNINRNQPRKDIPSTILAFELYKTMYNPNSFLYLHMNPDDLMGWNLRTVLAQTKLVQYEDYMFMPPDLIKNPPDPGFVNCIYNASDVYVTTTMGEGFGLTILEAMMAQVPVVAPFHTSIKELCGGEYNEDDERIFTTDASTPTVTTFDNMIRPKVDLESITFLIDKIHHDPELANKKVKVAHEFARSLSWNEVGKKWIEEFKRLL